MKIFDDASNDPKYEIDTFCGRKKDITIFSSEEYLQVEFSTKSGRPEPVKAHYIPYWFIEEDMKIRMRGFNATFEFSYDFVTVKGSQGKMNGDYQEISNQGLVWPFI